MTSRQHLESRPRACVSRGAQALAEFPILLQKTFISLLMCASFHYWHEYDFPTFIFLLYLEFFCVAVYKAILFFLLASKIYTMVEILRTFEKRGAWKVLLLCSGSVVFRRGHYLADENCIESLEVWVGPSLWETTSQLAFL